MSESLDTAEVILATVSYTDGQMVLRMENTDRTPVEFQLHPIAAAMLAITLTPAMKLAVEEQKRLHPEKFERGGFPDTPEGL